MKKVAKKSAKLPPSPPEWAPVTPDPIILGESAPAFQVDGAKRSRLLAILRDPVFREAVAILKNELEPRGDLAIFLKETEVAANRYHQFAGLNYLLDGFQRLAKEHRELKAPLGKSLTKELPKE